MGTPSYDDESRPLPPRSVPTDSACSVGATFSGKRIIRVLSCILSMSWVAMIHVTSAHSGGLGLIAPTDVAKVAAAVITAACMIPPLLFMRGWLMYAVGLPFVIIGGWTVWMLLAMLGTNYPGTSLPLTS